MKSVAVVVLVAACTCLAVVQGVEDPLEEEDAQHLHREKRQFTDVPVQRGSGLSFNLRRGNQQNNCRGANSRNPECQSDGPGDRRPNCRGRRKNRPECRNKNGNQNAGGAGGRQPNCNGRRRNRPECQNQNGNQNQGGAPVGQPNCGGRRRNRPECQDRQPGGGQGGGRRPRPVNCRNQKNVDHPDCQTQPTQGSNIDAALVEQLPWLTKLPSRGNNEVQVTHLPGVPRTVQNLHYYTVAHPATVQDVPYFSCRPPVAEEAYCRHLTHCILPEFYYSYAAYVPYACIINGRFLGTCCPVSFNNRGVTPTTTTTTTTPAPTPRPTLPPAQSTGCGIVALAKPPPTRIVGGTTVDRRQWPWLVSMFLEGLGNFCGGTLITNSHVLTAAHCTDEVKDSINEVRLRVGDYSYDDSSPASEHRVASFEQHEGYDPFTIVNDIAILKMDRPVQFTDGVRPACLPSQDKTFEGLIATVIGYGTIYFGGPVSTTLQQVTLPVWSNSRCDAAYEQNIIEKQLCAGDEEGGKDACQGDSGGPLLVKEGERWMVIGVVSWGDGCAKKDKPGVYTRCSKYLDWIRTHTAP